jgi:hypothetical protein
MPVDGLASKTLLTAVESSFLGFPIGRFNAGLPGSML